MKHVRINLTQSSLAEEAAERAYAEQIEMFRVHDRIAPLYNRRITDACRRLNLKGNRNADR